MNKVILMGRLTKDPETRKTQNNKAVCSFTLAVDRRFSKDETDFLPIVAWEKLAEFCGKYFTKGRQIAVVGRIQTRTWDDDDGKKHYVTEIVADEAYFADSKKDDSSGAVASGQQQQSQPPQQQQQSPPQQQSQPGGAKPPWMR